MKPPIIILIVVALLGLGGTGYYFMSSLRLQNEFADREKLITNLKEEKSRMEIELAVLKNSDLAKDLELTQLKLKTSEKDLSESKKEVARLGARVKTMEAGLNKMRPYLNAIEAIQKVVLGDTGITKSLVANADPKVSTLNDQEISGHWQKAKDNIDWERMGWQQRFFGDTISTIISRIFNLIPD